MPADGKYAAVLREKITRGVGGENTDWRDFTSWRTRATAPEASLSGTCWNLWVADCSGSQFLDPDGNFPNHIPNPEDRQAMEAIRGAVLAHKAHLGFIFDTDVDRMSAVLPDGTEVNRDAIIALAAAVLAPDCPGGTIVTDSVTSDRLTAFLEGDLGLKHRRFKRGYKNVINEAIRLNAEGVNCPMAMETSGHGALRENYFLDDGAYLAVKLTVALARHGHLGDLIAKLPPAVEEAEKRIPLSGEDFQEKGDRSAGGLRPPGGGAGDRAGPHLRGGAAFPARGLDAPAPVPP